MNKNCKEKWKIWYKEILILENDKIEKYE